MARRHLSVMLITVMVLAGSVEAGTTSFGIKAGLNISSITETPEAWNPDKSFKPAWWQGCS